MHYALLLHSGPPDPTTVSAADIEQMRQDFGVYGRALEAAGVLVAASVLQPPEATTTVTLRTGTRQVEDGPFAETKESLAGVFLIDVPNFDAALGWAERCPGARYGVIEIRAAATSCVGGTWTA